MPGRTPLARDALEFGEALPNLAVESVQLLLTLHDPAHDFA